MKNEREDHTGGGYDRYDAFCGITKSEDDRLMDYIDQQGVSAEKSKERYALFEHEFRKFPLDADAA